MNETVKSVLDLNPNWIILLLATIPLGMISMYLYERLKDWLASTSRDRARKRIHKLQSDLIYAATLDDNKATTLTELLLLLPELVFQGFMASMGLLLTITFSTFPVLYPSHIDPTIGLLLSIGNLVTMIIFNYYFLRFAWQWQVVGRIWNYHKHFAEFKAKTEAEIARLRKIAGEGTTEVVIS